MRPPLTRVELHIIHDRNRNEPDVEALLWEVARLRATVLKAHDYFRQSPTSSAAQILHERTLLELNMEPAIREQPKP